MHDTIQRPAPPPGLNTTRRLSSVRSGLATHSKASAIAPRLPGLELAGTTSVVAIMPPWQTGGYRRCPA